ncbi:MAG: M81 family metallopeptidase [Pseudomonadota bacterium]
MARVAIGGFQHETNTFAPTPAALEDFARPGPWPGWTHGAAIFEAVAGINVPIAGFIARAHAAGHQLVPLSWSQAVPSGPVTEAAYEEITGRLIEQLSQALKDGLDALYLDLHGAMVTSHLEDGEGELLARARALVGDDFPIVASLDLHANVTPRMVEYSDALISYRTYPHVDMAATGGRVARHLDRLLEAGPEYALGNVMVQLPFLIPIAAGCTSHEPAQGLYRRLAELEGGAVAALSFNCGFPLADIHHAGATALGCGAEKAAVKDAVIALAEAACDQEGAFKTPVWQTEEAVAHAIAHAGHHGGPIILVDSQDNPGGGADSDSVTIFAELVRQSARDAAVAIVTDREAAAAAHEAGSGRNVTLSLGAKCGWPGQAPFESSFHVEALSDGRFTATGPFYRGARIDLGSMALLRVGGVRVVVASQKMQAADQEIFRHLGLEPALQRILVLKSTAHFRAHFQPIAKEILIVEAPGPNAVDHSGLPYERLRPGLRVMPGGPVYQAAE